MLSCVTSTPCAAARDVIVASISELSQICRIGGRGIVENYTAEEVKFTSSAVRIMSSIPQVLLRVQRTLLEVQFNRRDRYVASPRQC